MIYKHVHHFESVSVGTKVIIKLQRNNICSWNSTEWNNVFTFIMFTKLIASWHLTVFSCERASSLSRAISYPFGTKMLNPEIKMLCPLNNSFTLIMTPTVPTLQVETMAHNPLGFRCNVPLIREKNFINAMSVPLILKIFHDLKEHFIFFSLLLKRFLHFLEIG